MKTLFLGNNFVGLETARWLKKQGDNVVGAVVHPATRSRFRKEICEVLELSPHEIFEADQIRDPAVMDRIAQLQPAIGVSSFFGYILKADFLSLFPEGCINLHPALLPYNRGANPNVWSIIEGTPAGVTLHYVDSQVDTGDIIAQREVPVDFKDTGATLYRKLEEASISLFQDTWPSIRGKKNSRKPQKAAAASTHRARDVEKIDPIRLDQNYKASDLLNILRARTFSPYAGAYVEVDGRKIYLRLQLLDENELKGEKT